MIELDRESILHATPEKCYIAALGKLHANFNEETAQAFYDSYKDMPLSFIMDHSREIFSEPYHGLSFYQGIIDHELMNPFKTESEIEKIEDYMNSLNSKNANPRQLLAIQDMYKKFLQSVSYGISSIMKPVLIDYDNADDFLVEVYDFLYEGMKSGDTKLLDMAAEQIFGSEIPQVQICIGLILCELNQDYVPYLVEASNEIFTAQTEEEYEFSATMRSVINMMMENGTISGHINSGIFGYRLKTLWNEVGRTPMDSATAFESADNLCVEGLDDMPMIHPSTDVLSIMEDMQHSEVFQKEKYARLCRERALINGTLKAYPMLEDIMDPTEEALYENLLSKRIYLEEEITAMEWEADGTPNAVLADEIKTTRDLAAKIQKRPMYRQLQGNNTSVAQSAESEDKLCKSIQKDIDAAKDPDTSEKELAKIRERAIDYEKEISDNEYSNAKAMMNNLNKRIYSEDFAERCGDLGDVEFAKFLKQDFDFLEGVDDDPKQKPQNSKKDSGEDTAAKEEPEEPESDKPKRDLAETLQDKALDREAKVAAKRASRNSKVSKLKNAARAVTSSPRRAVDGIKSFCDNFSKMDDNRRKKYLLKPGNRHRISKMMRSALKLGVVSHMKLAMVPFFGMLNHFSKEKDKRIRNELTRELETEIKICEEKINDANAQGDTKQKYELMRIHDKLVAEKTRVGYNSKYI